MTLTSGCWLNEPVLGLSSKEISGDGCSWGRFNSPSLSNQQVVLLVFGGDSKMNINHQTLFPFQTWLRQHNKSLPHAFTASNRVPNRFVVEGSKWSLLGSMLIFGGELMGSVPCSFRVCFRGGSERAAREGRCLSPTDQSTALCPDSG